MIGKKSFLASHNFDVDRLTVSLERRFNIGHLLRDEHRVQANDTVDSQR